MSIIFENLTKRFGNRVVFENLSLTIAPGECVCLLGRNGAGKSTLIHLLSDMMPPDHGTILIDGHAYAQNELAIKRQLGVLPERNPVIPELTGYQYLKFTGLLHRLASAEVERRAQSLIRFFFDNEEDGHKPLAACSHGMKQKIALCAAFVHRPAYLLLDEPFSGLDPVAAQKLAQLLTACCSRGAAAFMTAHNLSHVENIATRIVVLDEGRFKYDGGVQDLLVRAGDGLDGALVRGLQSHAVGMDQLSWLG